MNGEGGQNKMKREAFTMIGCGQERIFREMKELNVISIYIIHEKLYLSFKLQNYLNWQTNTW